MKQKLFIPFITAGDPDIETTEKLVYALEKAGADMIELGIPFSDPIADGPVIQEAHNRALTAGTTLIKIINLVKQIRKKSNIKLLFMMSYNSIIQYGEDKFIKDISAINLYGLVVPDLPFESSNNLRKKLKTTNIHFINFIAPTTHQNRITKIAKASSGFIYLISTTGVTGVRKNNNQENLSSLITQIKKHTKTPICIGFGIGDTISAKKAAAISDGIIVGSAIINLIKQHKKASIKPVNKFAKTIKDAIK
jgi:tryptophan synthase alpha chain